MTVKLYPVTDDVVEKRWSSGNNDAKLNGSNSGWQMRQLKTPSGNVSAQSLTVNTVAGPTAGIELQGTTFPVRFVSAPLSADFTVSGTITFNLWAAETNIADNAAINCQVLKIDGATGAITEIIKTARTTELTTSQAAANFTGTPTSTNFKRGDRVMVVIFADDAGTMGAGGPVTFRYNGGNAVEGDSWVQFTENLTFESTPAGSTIYLTDTASDVSTAAVDREAWTSRGAGVQNDVLTTVAGWTAPLQMTDTAGGTVVDWFTKKLTAFTLGGAVALNIRMDRTTDPNGAARVEIAVCDGDGSNAVNWAVATSPDEILAGENVFTWWVSGDDISVTDGQRLRIRVLVDDIPGAAMLVGDAKLLYAGTSSGASGDTFLTFVQTLTEFTGSGSILPTAIAGGEVIGSHTLLPGGVNVLPTAIASGEAIGSHTLKPTNIIDLVGQAIASAEAIGSHILKATATILPTAIASGETLGTPVLLPGGVLVIPAGIATSEQFGAVSLYSLATIAPAGIASLEAIGSHTLIHGGVFIAPAGITSAELLGNPTLLAIANILPSAIASAEALGTPTLAAIANILVSGIASSESIGSHTLLPGNVNILPGGIASAEAIGSHILSTGGFFIIPTGIASAEAIGSHTLLPGGVVILPSGITSSEVIGAHTFLPGAVFILPNGLASGEVIGAHTLLHGGVLILPSGVTSGEIIGTHTLLPGGVNILPGGIASGEIIGSHTLVLTGGGALFILPAGISSAEIIGSHTLRPGGVNILPGGIVSGEASGSLTVLPGAILVVPTAIGSAEALGGPVILHGPVVIAPQGVVTSEAVPAPQIIPGGVIILPVGVASGQAIGAATLYALASILPAGISTSEVLGTAQLLPGPVVISPLGVDSGEAIGIANILTFIVGGWQWVNKSPDWQSTKKRGWPPLQDNMARTHEGGD